MKNCENCGADIDENALSCEYCGTKTDQNDKQDMSSLTKKKPFKLILCLSACLIVAIGIIVIFTRNVNSTYKWAEPIFSSASTTKEFSDFKISYPSNWSVTKSVSIEEA